MAMIFESSTVWNTESAFLSRGKIEAENEWDISMLCIV